ncbi:hypothetical protein NE236_38320 [Actinoallomurus purpureus]|uniref:hypothetical protein n=1 Tax=Actinoallomurus purpureus TaxID=478114 RepID=UPI00209386D6|nr:hypothetical protein [Actinoallomurus purpureus]MCO6010831.1 hypothetical protein [Actinoallomurus purpureus]
MIITNVSHTFVLEPSSAPIRNLVTKLGGQPAWLAEPHWPLSRQLGRPMKFLGQFQIPGEKLRLAYLFMTDDDEFVNGTWEPEGGENALIVQPGRVPGFVTTMAEAEGPSICADVAVELMPASKDLTDDVDARLGGEPTWLQAEEYPSGGDWAFLFQLDYATEH